MSTFGQQIAGLATACVPLHEWVAEQLSQGERTIDELKSACPRAGVSHEDIRLACKVLVSEQRGHASLDEENDVWRYSLAAKPVTRVAEAPGYATRADLRAAVLAHICAAANPPTASQIALALDAPSALVSQCINHLKNGQHLIKPLPAIKGTHLRYVATDSHGAEAAEAAEAAEPASPPVAVAVTSTQVEPSQGMAPVFALDSTGRLVIDEDGTQIELNPAAALALADFTARVRPAIEAALANHGVPA
jgi:hypothetical protein